VVYDLDNPEIADKSIFIQNFSNYYAYDDGTAEAGYGLSPAGSMMAVQFETEEADTLRGVQIYFNKVLNSNNDRPFDIWVWRDNNGEPGNKIYDKINVRPYFYGINQFHTYIFNDTILKLGREVFYVGIVQSTDDNLNVGFDKNTDSRGKIFFNTLEGWNNTEFNGSVMIRPLFGRELAPYDPPAKTQQADFMVFPNPPNTDGLIKFELPFGNIDAGYRKFLSLRIYDLYGRLIHRCAYTDELNVSFLKQGLYIINLLDGADSRSYSTKLFIPN
jgi:hypothetical protein